MPKYLVRVGITFGGHTNIWRSVLADSEDLACAKAEEEVACDLKSDLDGVISGGDWHADSEISIDASGIVEQEIIADA